MRPLPLLALCLTLIACATAVPPKRPAGMAPSDVMIRPIGSLSCGPGGTAPINLAVRVTNRASESIMVRSIKLSSPAAQRVVINSEDLVVNGFLEASQTDIFPVTVAASVSPTANPNDPVTLRAEIEFEARGIRFRETFDLPNIPL